MNHIAQSTDENQQDQEDPVIALAFFHSGIFPKIPGAPAKHQTGCQFIPIVYIRNIGFYKIVKNQPKKHYRIHSKFLPLFKIFRILFRGENRKYRMSTTS